MTITGSTAGEALSDDELAKFVRNASLKKFAFAVRAVRIATELQTLRALSRRSSDGVGVKALEWIDAALVHRFGLIVRVATSSIGEYRVLKGSQGRFDGFIDSGQVTGSYDTIEAAQEALQSDFDQRIRSALDPTPVSGVEPVGYIGAQTLATLRNMAGKSPDTFLHIFGGKRDGWNAIPLYPSPQNTGTVVTEGMVERAAIALRDLDTIKGVMPYYARLARAALTAALQHDKEG